MTNFTTTTGFGIVVTTDEDGRELIGGLSITQEHAMSRADRFSRLRKFIKRVEVVKIVNDKIVETELYVRTFGHKG